MNQNPVVELISIPAIFKAAKLKAILLVVLAGAAMLGIQYVSLYRIASVETAEKVFLEEGVPSLGERMTREQAKATGYISRIDK